MKLFIFILIYYTGFISAASNHPSKIFINTASSIFNKVAGEKIQEEAAKLKRTVDEKLGNDVAVRDPSTMSVEMVSVVEPFKNYPLVSDSLSDRAESLLRGLRSIKNIDMSKEKIIYDEFKEAVLISRLLAENDYRIITALLRTDMCLLTDSEGKYFEMGTNPCVSLAKEAFIRILDRFEEIQEIKQIHGQKVQIERDYINFYKRIAEEIDKSYLRMISDDDKLLQRWQELKRRLVLE